MEEAYMMTIKYSEDGINDQRFKILAGIINDMSKSSSINLNGLISIEAWVEGKKETVKEVDDQKVTRREIDIVIEFLMLNLYLEFICKLEMNDGI